MYRTCSPCWHINHRNHYLLLDYHRVMIVAGWTEIKKLLLHWRLLVPFIVFFLKLLSQANIGVRTSTSACFSWHLNVEKGHCSAEEKQQVFWKQPVSSCWVLSAGSGYTQLKLWLCNTFFLNQLWFLKFLTFDLSVRTAKSCMLCFFVSCPFLSPVGNSVTWKREICVTGIQSNTELMCYFYNKIK